MWFFTGMVFVVVVFDLDLFMPVSKVCLRKTPAPRH